MMPEKEIAYRLLSVILEYAPDEAAQKQGSDLYNLMRADGASWPYVIKNLAAVLSAGLNHGNWPWNVGRVDV